MRSRSSLVLFWCALTILVAGARAAAQVPAAHVVLTGTVVDPLGAVLPNADVELDAAGSVPVHTTTDATGTFSFDAPRRGAYDVHVTFEGFEPTTAHVVIGTRSPAPLRVTLPLAGLMSQITVSSSSPQVDTSATRNRDALTVTDETLADLPVFDQDYVAAMSRFLDSAAIGTSGVTLVVNGMEANGLGVSASAIKEIKINQNPYSAEFNRPGRGRIEVITKPGSSSFHGTANAIFRDSRFEAKNAFALEKPDEQRRIFEGYLGGPIFDGERTSFVLSFNHDEHDQQAIVHAYGPAGLIAGNVPNPYRNTFVSGSISRQQGDANTLSLRSSFQYRRTTNQGVGGIVLPEAGTDNLFHEFESVYTHDTVLRPTLLHQVRLLYGQYFNGSTSVTDAPAIVVVDSFVGGGAQADQLRTEHHIELKDTLTWNPKHQTIKAGIDIPDWSRRRFDDNTNRLGTFSFSNLNDYETFRPYVFVQQRGDGHLVFLEKVLGLFAQDDVEIAANITASIGLRYDWQNYFHDNNDFGARAALAWAVTDKRTVVRIGAGLFHDRTGPGPISDLLHSEQGLLDKYVITNPGYPVPVPPGTPIGAVPRSLVELSPDATIPAMWQYSAGLERQLVRTLTLSATYIGMWSDNQFLSRDVNAPPPTQYAARPDSSSGVVREIESTGRLRSNALQVTLRGGITRSVAVQTQYTLSKTTNDTGGISWFPSNDYDRSTEWGRADYDQRQRFDLLGTVKVGTLFNVGAALALYSGKPYSLLAGADLYENGRSNARQPGVTRNTLSGPEYADLDLRWFREFALRRSAPDDDGTKLTVGVDAFNASNRVNEVSYVGTITSPFFGRAVAAQPPRRLQLSLRLSF